MVSNGFGLHLSMWLTHSLITFWQRMNERSWTVWNILFGFVFSSFGELNSKKKSSADLLPFRSCVAPGCRERGVADHTQQHYVRPSPDGPTGSGPRVRRVWHHVSRGGGSVGRHLQGDHRPKDQRGCARVRNPTQCCKSKWRGKKMSC